MSILGKILAILNILGVAGFVALASMTYTKRQAWELANIRADLVVDGLPIDDLENDKEAIPLVRRIPPHLLDEMFAASPVATQVAEVNRVRVELDALLSAADTVRKKDLLLARLLIPMGGSYNRFEQYVDREFYLSMQAQLSDDQKFATFIKILGDAIPNAIAAMRLDPQRVKKEGFGFAGGGAIAVTAKRFDPKRGSFEAEFQKALEQLPGEDKWKLAEAFLNKLPRSITFTKRSLAFAHDLVKEISARDAEYQKEEDNLADRDKRPVRLLDKNLKKATGEDDVAAASAKVAKQYTPLLDKTFDTPELAAQELAKDLGAGAQDLLARRIVSDMAAERFLEAVDAAKDAAEDLEAIAAAKTYFQDVFQRAKAASLIADFESKIDPKDEKKADLAKQLREELPVVEARLVAADQAAKLLPDPRVEAAVVFLESIRKDKKKNDTPQADYIKEVVEKVVGEALEDVRIELTARYEDAYKDAAQGQLPGPDAAQFKLIRDRRRQVIARFLFAALAVLAGDPEVDALQTRAISVDKADAEKKWKFENATIEPTAYQRFITVVGVEAAIGAIAEQQAALVAVEKDVNDRILKDRYNFRYVHHDRIQSLKRRADEVNSLAVQVQEVLKQAESQVTITKGEAERVEIYVNDLKVARGKTVEEMKQLYKISEDLIKVRVAIRNAINNNAINLGLITELEKEVLALQREVAAKDRAEREAKRRQP